MIVLAYATVVASLVASAPTASDLMIRQALLREQLKSQPEAAALWSELGLVCVALGELTEAQEAFSQRIQWTKSKGDEPLEVSRPLAEALAIQRALFTTEGSLAAAYNNRGAARLLRGELDEALKDLDQAAVLQPEWAPPWTNGALLWLERNNPQKATDTAITARSLGGESPQTLTILGEAALRRRQWETARAQLQRAQELLPNYPYSLLVRALLDEAQGRGREAERLRMQALALLAQTATRGNVIPKRHENQLALGGGERLQVRTLKQGASERRFTSSEFRLDHEAVESRSNAKQTSVHWQSLVGTTQSQGSQGIFTRLVQESGQRPGKIGEVAIYQQQQYATVGLLKRRETPKGVVLMALTPRFNRFPTLKDAQLGADLRIDRSTALGQELTFGGAWLYNQRTGYQPGNAQGFPAPAEPNGQLLGPGATHLGVAYAIITRQTGPGKLWRLGSVIGWQQSALASLPTRAAYGGLLTTEKKQSVSFLPYAEWLSPLKRNQHLHIALRPQLNAACGELTPAYLLAAPLSSLPGSKTVLSTNDRLLDLFLPGPQGKRWDAEASLSQTTRQIMWQATLFQRTLENGYLLADDPRFVSTLPLQPTRRERTTGLTLQSTFSHRGLGWEGGLTYQSVRNLSLPTWDARLRLDASPTGARRRYFGEVRHLLSSTGTYIVGGGSGSTSVTLLQLGGEVPLSSKGEAFFQLQTPLSSSRAFFTGYPIGTQLVFGIRRPF